MGGVLLWKGDGTCQCLVEFWFCNHFCVPAIQTGTHGYSDKASASGGVVHLFGGSGSDEQGIQPLAFDGVAESPCVLLAGWWQFPVVSQH